METVRLNTIILPSKVVIESASSLSQMYAGKGNASFVLDGKSYYPHITLYSPEYPVKTLKKVTDEVAKVAKRIKSFSLTLKGITKTETGGISADYFAEDKALQLRKQIIHVLSPLREGNIREKYKSVRGLSNLEREEIHEYGYPINKHHFPHITLSHFEDKTKTEIALREIDTKAFPSKCSVKVIAIGEMGSFGTVTKIVSRFDLQ